MSIESIGVLSKIWKILDRKSKDTSVEISDNWRKICSWGGNLQEKYVIYDWELHIV